MANAHTFNRETITHLKFERQMAEPDARYSVASGSGDR
jgi:hypothetical protein